MEVIYKIKMLFFFCFFLKSRQIIVKNTSERVKVAAIFTTFVFPYIKMTCSTQFINVGVPEQ